MARWQSISGADGRQMPELARFLHPEGDGASDPAPAIAIAGLAKAVAAVPNAPATRLALGTEPASRGVVPVARGTPMLVARGDHDSPERAKAQAVPEGLADR
jgi:hypothetical protein